MKNILPYITILILLIILFFKNCSDKPDIQAPKIDTVIVQRIIHDTIPGEIVFVKQKKDTVWLKSIENTPDTTYEGLLRQYTELGNKLFTKKLFSTKFKIKDYGFITVNDSISENSLIHSDIITDLKIPMTTITVTKYPPLKRELYLGFKIMGNKEQYIRNASIDALLKDKKDHIYDASIGYDGKVIFGGGMLWKLKFNKNGSSK